MNGTFKNRDGLTMVDPEYFYSGRASINQNGRGVSVGDGCLVSVHEKMRSVGLSISGGDVHHALWKLGTFACFVKYCQELLDELRATTDWEELDRLADEAKVKRHWEAAKRWATPELSPQELEAEIEEMLR